MKSFKLIFLIGAFLLFVNVNTIQAQCNYTPTFTGNASTICKNESITFSINNPNSGYTYQWYFDNVQDGTASTKTKVFNTSGSIEVKLVADSLGICTDSTMIIVLIKNKPNPTFTISNDNMCSPVNGIFTNTTSGNNISYVWKEDGTQFSTTTNANKNYDIVGNGTVTFDIRLVATSNFGCMDSIQQVFTTKMRPHASIDDQQNQEKFKSCGSTISNPTYTFNLNNTSSTSATNTNYIIDWGDGSTNYNNPTLPSGTSHTYNTLGYLPLVLTVSDGNGCTSTDTYQLFNGTNPSLGFASVSGTIGLCSPTTLLFDIDTSKTNNNAPGTTYTMIFDDGSPDDVMVHPVLPEYYHTFTSSSCGHNTNNTNDSYSIKLKAENGCGVKNITIDPIQLGSIPTADFTSVESLCIGNSFTFNATTSGDVTITSSGTCYYNDGNYIWSVTPMTGVSFNNNNNSSVTIQFDSIGAFDVKMVIDNSSSTNGCGADSITKTIHIVAPPVASFIPSFHTNIIISGDSSILTTTNTSNTIPAENSYGAIYNWSVSVLDTSSNCNFESNSWNFSSTDSTNDVEPSFVFHNAGFYEITLIATNACGSSAPYKDTIEITRKPIVSINDLSAICSGDSINASAVVDTCYGDIISYSWNFSGGTPNIANTLTPPAVSFTNNTNGNITQTISLTVETSGGSTTVNKNVIIKPLPQVPAISSTSPICDGDSLTLSVVNNAALSYQWQHPDGAISDTFAFTSYTPFADWYYITVSNGLTNCINTDSTLIEIDTLPIINIIATNQNPCVNTPIMLTASGATTYTWQLQGGNLTTNPLSLSPTQDSTYEVIGIDDNGCKNTTSIFIDTIALPIVNAGQNTVVCYQTPAIPVQLTGTQNTGSSNDGTWSAISNILPNTINPNGTFTPNDTASNIQLIYTYTDTITGCTNSDTMEVDVILPDNAIAGNDTAVCQGSDPLILGGNNPNGVWRDASNAIITEFNPTTDGTFQLTYSIGAGSCISQDMMTITVHPLPVITLQNDFTICRYDTTVILNNNTGTWTGIGIEAGTANFLPMNVPTNSTTLNYSVTDINNCTNDDDLIVTVNDVTTANAGTDQTFCNITTDIPLTGFSPTTNGTGTWSGNGMQNNSQGIFNSNGVSGIYEVYYTFVNNDNCENTDTIEITVNDLVKPILQNDTAVCINTSNLTLTASEPNGIWIKDGQPFFNPFTPNQSGVYEFIYTIESNTTCESSDTLEIRVEDLPQLTLSNDFAACEDTTLIDLSENPFGGTWTGTGITDAANGIFDVSNGTQTVTYTYVESQVFYGNTLACSNNDNVTITVNSLPTVTVKDTIPYCLVNYNIALPMNTPDVSPTGGTWSGLGITAPDQFNPTNAGGIGDYTATYTFIDGNGCENSDNMHIRVEASDSVSAGFNDTICITESPALLTDFYPTTGGTWSGTGITNASTGMYNPTQAGAGIDTLTFTYGNGTCEISVDKYRLVVDTTVINAGSDQTACLNEPAFQLTGFTPTGGIWSGTDVNAAGIFTPTTVNSFVLKYTYAEPINGCISEDYKTIVINDLPIPNAQDDTTLCASNTTIQLPQGTANVIGTGVWTGSNAIIANTNLSVNPSLIGANNTDTLLFTFTDNFGCSVTDSMEIAVIESDSINAGAKDTVCINTGAEVLVGYPTGGIWSGTGIIVDSIFNNDNNNTPAGIYTLTYTFDNGNGGCVVTATRERTVRALPIVDAGSDEDRCLNESPFQLTGFTPTGGRWSGLFVDSAGVYTPTQIGSIALGYTYKDFFGCENFDAKTITINPLPTPNAQNDTILCDVNTTIILPQGTPILGGTGVWTGSNAIIANSDLSVNPSLIGANNTDTLLFTFTDNFGCSVTDTMEIAVIESDSINAGANDTVCINTGAEVLVGYPAGGTWSGTGIINNNTFNNDNNNTPAGIYTLTYTFDNGNGGCEVVDTRIRTVRPLPIVDGGIDTLVCIETPAFTMFGFSPITDLLGTGIWTGNGITNENLGIFESDTAGIGQHTLTYTYTDFVGCIDSNTRVIDVVDLPIIDSLVGFDTLCNQPIPSQYIGYQNSGNPNDGVWSGQNMASDGTFTPNGVGNFTVYYCYDDINTCKRCDSIVITVIPAEPIEAGIADTICIDEGIHTLTADFPTGGFWSGSMAIIDADLGTFDPMIATSGWHTVTYTFGTGTCLVSDTTGVYVRDLAFVDAGANQNACDTDADFAITGFSPTGGIWSGTGITNNSGIFSPNSVTAGTYPITYFYTDPITGCDTSRVKNVTIHPLAQPDFTFDTILCINVPYTIADLSTNTTQWLWDFGDGTTYATQNPTHTYTTTGNYTIKLIAESVHGCKDSTFLNVFVTEIPTASFVKDTAQGCTPLPVNFTNTSVGDSMSYSWNLGNSSPLITTLNPPTTIYEDGTQDTTYYITLTTSNLCGADIFEDSILVYPKPQIIFAPDVNSGCTPLNIDFVNNSLGNPDDYYWNYGDGNLDTLTTSATHSHTFYTDTTPTVYTITLIAENECGLDTATTSLTVHPVTVESFFNADTSIGCQPFTVNFTNYSTQGTTVIWNFGDGSSSDTIGTTSHTFQQAGTFKVVQYVTNGCGYDSTFTWITVLSSPTASFTSQNNICEDAPLTFTNTTANTTGQLWDFGDGNTSTDSIATHTYTTAGTYQVTLQVFNNTSQCPGFITQTITILPKPIAIFSASDTTGCEDLAVQFTDTSIGNLTGYSYNFGDTNGSANPSPTHTYLDSGVYTVKYVVVDANTCVSDTVSNDIVVYPIPNSDFAFAILDSCAIPTDVQFTNLSQGATGYEWTVDNSGNFLTANNPTVTYNSDGIYNINLTAINSFGCRDSIQQTFELFAPPVAVWTVDQPNHCEPSTVTFTSNSIGNGITHFYDF
ncbi:MAG: PKD domain-containing protein, partial [Saprospiraceae bacterium]